MTSRTVRKIENSFESEGGRLELPFCGPGTLLWETVPMMIGQRSCNRLHSPTECRPWKRPRGSCLTEDCGGSKRSSIESSARRPARSLTADQGAPPGTPQRTFQFSSDLGERPAISHSWKIRYHSTKNRRDRTRGYRRLSTVESTRRVYQPSMKRSRKVTRDRRTGRG